MKSVSVCVARCRYRPTSRYFTTSSTTPSRAHESNLLDLVVVNAHTVTARGAELNYRQPVDGLELSATLARPTAVFGPVTDPETRVNHNRAIIRRMCRRSTAMLAAQEKLRCGLFARMELWRMAKRFSTSQTRLRSGASSYGLSMHVSVRAKHCAICFLWQQPYRIPAT